MFLILFILHTENRRVHSYPVENDIKLRMISYLGRLISGKHTKLSSICYRLALDVFITMCVLLVPCS